MDKERTEMEVQMKRLKQELQTAQLEINKTIGQYKEAQTQIQMLSKEKGNLVVCDLYRGRNMHSFVDLSAGVAMRDNAVSYKQSIQLESKMRELEAERQILQQQRDIANKEREKVVMESVSHKVRTKV